MDLFFVYKKFEDILKSAKHFFSMLKSNYQKLRKIWSFPYVLKIAFKCICFTFYMF